MHTPRHTPPRFDYAVRIEGPLLAQHPPGGEAAVDGRAAHAVRRRLARFERPRARSARRAARSARLFSCATTSGTATTSRTRISRRSRGARSEILIANSYFFPGVALPARARGGRGARRAGDPAAAGARRIPAAALRDARALRRAARRRHRDPRVSQEFSAREGRGDRPPVGDGRAPRTSIRSACCSRAKRTSWSTTRRLRRSCGRACSAAMDGGARQVQRRALAPPAVACARSPLDLLRFCPPADRRLRLRPGAGVRLYACRGSATAHIGAPMHSRWLELRAGRARPHAVPHKWLIYRVQALAPRLLRVCLKAGSNAASVFILLLWYVSGAVQRARFFACGKSPLAAGAGSSDSEKPPPGLMLGFVVAVRTLRSPAPR